MWLVLVLAGAPRTVVPHTVTLVSIHGFMTCMALALIQCIHLWLVLLFIMVVLSRGLIENGSRGQGATVCKQAVRAGCPVACDLTWQRQRLRVCGLSTVREPDAVSHLSVFTYERCNRAAAERA